MTSSNAEFNLADLADGTLAGPEWEEWLTAHPDLAAEVAVTRQVRALLGELRAVPIALSADFEAALMERVRRDATLLGLLDLWLAGFGRALLDLLTALFGAPPSPAPAAAQ
ncbi:MAG: hypothetical protein M3354_07670 [Chloroflexota bacterium]|nr:hypothetical protein [Chloroflexota bacterium]